MKPPGQLRLEFVQDSSGDGEMLQGLAGQHDEPSPAASRVRPALDIAAFLQVVDDLTSGLFRDA
ncbi:hypothetical protein M271_39075 [Streptomyces rapamycinicus NRRL 5491]|nr:hypothetical protein M271_39075 [Streptomyces rapamycinicus NRRL 5491]